MVLYSTDIEIVWVGAQDGADAIQHARVKIAAFSQFVQTIIDQVVADMRTARRNSLVDAGLLRRIARQHQRHIRNLNFIHGGFRRYFGDCDPIHVAAFEIHARVGIGWVLAQNVLEGDQGFQNIRPNWQADLMQTQQGRIQCSIARRQVAECSRSLSQNFFQQGQFQRDWESPQFAKT